MGTAGFGLWVLFGSATRYAEAAPSGEHLESALRGAYWFASSIGPFTLAQLFVRQEEGKLATVIKAVGRLVWCASLSMLVFGMPFYLLFGIVGLGMDVYTYHQLRAVFPAFLMLCIVVGAFAGTIIGALVEGKRRAGP